MGVWKSCHIENLEIGGIFTLTLSPILQSKIIEKGVLKKMSSDCYHFFNVEWEGREQVSTLWWMVVCKNVDPVYTQ